jgi:hypothetical protein
LCSKLYNHPLTTLCSYDGYLDCLLWKVWVHFPKFEGQSSSVQRLTTSDFFPLLLAVYFHR